MSTHYNEPIQEYWVDETKRGEKKHWIKLKMTISIISISLLYILIEDTILIILIFLLSCMLLWLFIEEHITQKKINELKRQNKNFSLPQNFLFIQDDLLKKFNIPNNYITILIDIDNETSNISCYYIESKYYLIICPGYFDLIKNDLSSAQVIYAHELSHIRQKDPNNIFVYKTFARIQLLFIEIPLLLTYLYLIFYGPIIFDFYMLYIIISIVIRISLAHKKAYDCERNADIGTSLLYGTEKLKTCLKEYTSELSFYKKILLKAPSLQWRLDELNNLEKYYPELASIQNEIQSILPILEKFK